MAKSEKAHAKPEEQPAAPAEKTEKVTAKEVSTQITQTPRTVTSRRGSPDAPGRIPLAGMQRARAMGTAPAPSGFKTVADIVRERGTRFHNGPFDRLRQQIAGKAIELLNEKADKDAPPVPSVDQMTAAAMEALPNAVLGLYLLEWAKDHKGKTADLSSLIDQGARVLVALTTV